MPSTGNAGHNHVGRATIVPHPATLAAHYTSIGLALVAIPAGSKAPNGNGWQKRPITTPAAAREHWERHPSDNMGLVHAHSGTATLDLDHLDHAREVFADFGIDLDALIAANPYRIRGARGEKPIYRAPAGESLKIHKLAWPADPSAVIADGEKPKAITIFELRAKGGQDVLPPSIHPSGVQYEWVNDAPQSYEDLPELPAELLDLWHNWDAYRSEMVALCPWAAHGPPQPAPAPRSHDHSGDSVIDAYNSRYSVLEMLGQHGYKARGPRRYLSPHSSSGMPGVLVFEDGRVFSHHGGDLFSDSHSHDAFDLYRLLEHAGDWKQAIKAAAQLLGMAGYLRHEGYLRHSGHSGTASNNSLSDTHSEAFEALGHNRSLPNASNAPNPTSTPKSQHEQAAQPSLVRVDMNKEMRQIEFLVPDLVPAGYVTILGAREGVGKTTALTSLLWQMSRPAGRGRWLDIPVPYGNSVYVNTDAPDGESRTVRFWLEKHKAAYGDGNMDSITVFEPGDAGLLAADWAMLEDHIKANDVKAVVLDSFMGTFTAIDQSRADAVLGPLVRLRNVAARTGVALIVTDHLPKKAVGERDGDRGVMGSVAKTAQARSVLLLTRIAPNECEGKNAVKLTVEKQSYTNRLEPFGLEFEFGGMDSDTEWVKLTRFELPEDDTRPAMTRAKAAVNHALKLAVAGAWVPYKHLVAVAVDMANVGERWAKDAVRATITDLGDSVEVTELATPGKPKSCRLKVKTVALTTEHLAVAPGSASMPQIENSVPDEQLFEAVPSASNPPVPQSLPQIPQASSVVAEVEL
jgi:hypothetical protein